MSATKTKNLVLGHRTYMVPVDLLADIIEEKQTSILLMDLVKEICCNTGKPQSGIERAVRTILSRQQKAINVDIAEQILMGIDLYLDINIELPVLPGNKALATELVNTRANIVSSVIKLDQKDMDKLIDKTIELSIKILEDPYNAPYYQDQAPFDCLRAP